MTSDPRTYGERLQAELDALIIDIAESNDAGGTVELDQTRVGRLSRMDAMQQQAMAKNTHERYGIRRRQIEAALGLAASGRRPVLG
ncbi:hypothetical protein CKO25_14525 [Thiocapsa imhoffii]|uniref:Uncharacterized protein n=1 Tax=Thiocapsa imhoffii TaxID=382777 RepID=A0A9X0WKJ4_9GAMM|nr:hypothetical protein [Thiocapsa imhoffii]